jgi:hypothetical protein
MEWDGINENVVKISHFFSTVLSELTTIFWLRVVSQIQTQKIYFEIILLKCEKKTRQRKLSIFLIVEYLSWFETYIHSLYTVLYVVQWKNFLREEKERERVEKLCIKWTWNVNRKQHRQADKERNDMIFSP